MLNARDRPRTSRVALSLTLRNYHDGDPGSWEPTLQLARDADAAGVDRLVVSDHVAFGERLDDYGHPEFGGRTGGKQPTGPDGHWLEPLTFLAVIGAFTERIRLMTGILLAPLRPPAFLAKQATTIDVLTGGRLDLGVGVGWQEAEYHANGVSFQRRGKILDRTLEICQRLWSDDAVDFDDGELTFSRIHQMPKPVQAGGVPVWVSGQSSNQHVVRRLVRFGSGWLPWGPDMQDPRAGIKRLRAALADAGRDPELLQVTMALPKDLTELPPLVAAGVTDFRLHAATRGDELVSIVENVRRFVGTEDH